MPLQDGHEVSDPGQSGEEAENIGPRLGSLPQTGLERRRTAALHGQELGGQKEKGRRSGTGSAEGRKDFGGVVPDKTERKEVERGLGGGDAAAVEEQRKRNGCRSGEGLLPDGVDQARQPIEDGDQEVAQGDERDEPEMSDPGKFHGPAQEGELGGDFRGRKPDGSPDPNDGEERREEDPQRDGEPEHPAKEKTRRASCRSPLPGSEQQGGEDEEDRVERRPELLTGVAKGSVRKRIADVDAHDAAEGEAAQGVECDDPSVAAMAGGLFRRGAGAHRWDGVGPKRSRMTSCRLFHGRKTGRRRPGSCSGTRSRSRRDGGLACVRTCPRRTRVARNPSRCRASGRAPRRARTIFPG